MYRIKELRKAAGMSTYELAAKSGVSRTTIYLLETNQNHVCMTDTLFALANALDVGIGDLFLPRDTVH